MITVPQILEEVSSFKDITVEEMKSGSRKKEIVDAKHLFFFTCNHYRSFIKRKYTLSSLVKFLNLVNHTSALHSINQYQSLIDYDSEVRTEWDAFRNYLESSYTVTNKAPQILLDVFINKLRATTTNDEWRELILNK